jgi:hypothetical protein
MQRAPQLLLDPWLRALAGTGLRERHPVSVLASDKPLAFMYSIDVVER